MRIGEEGAPQGVRGGGIWARGWKGGEGREERPVPPIMAMGTGSGGLLGGGERGGARGDGGTRLGMWLGGFPLCGWGWGG